MGWCTNNVKVYTHIWVCTGMLIVWRNSYSLCSTHQMSLEQDVMDMFKLSLTGSSGSSKVSRKVQCEPLLSADEFWPQVKYQVISLAA